METILTERAVRADEAHRIGLVNEVVADGGALAQALCGFQQTAMRNDRVLVPRGNIYPAANR
jgi:enoyl-CoA hydratase/carnithine racemase